MEAHIMNLLVACADVSQEGRQKAEKELQVLQDDNLGEFVLSLASILVDESQQDYIRQLAGLVLKNAISAKDKRLNSEKSEKWIQLPVDITNIVKKKALDVLKNVNTSNNNTTVSRAACQIVSIIAKIELCLDRWEEFFPTILKLITEGSSLHKEVSLTALRFLCEDLTEILEETGQNPLKKQYCNEILTSVVQGMRDESNPVKAAATKALFNALLFAKENFDNESERNFIMQVICQNCEVANAEVQIAAFECLVQIAAEYYFYLKPYMCAIAPMTLEALKNGSEEVAIAAMEFWNAICDEEIELELCENELNINNDINKTNNITNNLNTDSNNLFSSNISSSATSSTSTSFTPSSTLLSSSLDASNASNNASNSSSKNNKFIKQAMNHLIPVLLELLTRQQTEDTEIDTWTVAMAAGTSLSLCSQVLGNDIIGIVLDFVRTNFSSEDWKRREAAVLAFGCIMDGPDTKQLQPLVQESFANLCKVLADNSVAVRDTAAWTIGRITAFHPDVTFIIINNNDSNNVSNNIDLIGVSDNNNNNLMVAIVSRLCDCPRVAVHICWIINGLAENIEKISKQTLNDYLYNPNDFLNSNNSNEKIGDLSSIRGGVLNLKTKTVQCNNGIVISTDDNQIIRTPLDPIFNQLCDELVRVAERNDADERNLREAAYNCLSTLIKSVGTSCRPSMEKLLLHLLNKLDNSFMFEQNEECRKVQGSICGCIQCIITRLDSNVKPHAQQIWSRIYKILMNGGQSTDLSEDALLAVSALATVMGVEFEEFMPAVSQILLNGLTRFEDVQTCRICTELVGDVSRALGERFVNYSESCLHLIYTSLSNPCADRTLKPGLMIAVGDIAMAIHRDFIRFLTPFMLLLIQAAATTHDMGPIDNEEWVLYIGDLREGVLQAYSGIVYGMKDGDMLDALKVYVNGMLEFIKAIAETPEYFLRLSNLKSAIALTGDLASAYGKDLCVALMNAEWLKNMVQRAITLPDVDESLRDKVQWLQRVLVLHSTSS